MPQVAVDEHFAFLTVRRGIEHFLHRFLPAFIGVMTEDHRRFAAQLQQEARQPHHEIRIAVEAEFFAMQPGVGIQHHVDQPAALQGQSVGDRFAGQLTDGHQQRVGGGQAQRNGHLGGGLVPHLLNHLFAFHQLPRLQQQGVNGVRRGFDLLLAGAAGVHPVMAVGGGVEHL